MNKVQYKITEIRNNQKFLTTTSIPIYRSPTILIVKTRGTVEGGI